MMEIQNFQESVPALGRIIGLTLPGVPPEVCQDLATSELENFMSIAQVTPALQNCTKESVLAGIKSVLIKGLSMDPSLNLVYMQTRNHNIGSRDAAKWVTRLEVRETVNGALWMAKTQGALKGWEKPVVEYDKNGKVELVSWTYHTDSGSETFEMDQAAFARLAAFSAKQNKGTANALYTSYNGGIDPGFASAKVIRHGLKNLGLNPLGALRRPVAVTEYPVIEAKEEFETPDTEDINLSF